MEPFSPAMFVADAPGLDFLNSIATPVDVPVDWIADGEGLLRWIKDAKLVSDDVLNGVRARSSRRDIDLVAKDARALREWFRAFVRKHMGRPLKSRALTELEPLNQLLGRDNAYLGIVLRDGGAFALERTRSWRTASSLLQPIGESLAKLVCDEGFVDIKACEGPACTLLFADHTRARRRRWCSMAVCGNRAKQAAHRSRLKDAS